jgi:hypothetical protein
MGMCVLYVLGVGVGWWWIAGCQLIVLRQRFPMGRVGGEAWMIDMPEHRITHFICPVSMSDCSSIWSVMLAFCPAPLFYPWS